MMLRAKTKLMPTVVGALRDAKQTATRLRPDVLQALELRAFVSAVCRHEDNVATAMLRGMGVDEQATAHAASPEFAGSGRCDTSTTVQDVLSRAQDLATTRTPQRVGTGHVLLALLELEPDLCAEVFGPVATAPKAATELAHLLSGADHRPE